jgi:long-chain acyl-CoA synthetase
MERDFNEVLTEVTGPGQMFETVDVVTNGVTVKAFKNAPPTVRSLLDGARTDTATFLVYEDEEWSYADVMREADALAYALVHTYGVGKGDRVGIAMRNLPEWIVSFAAITGIGAVSVSMNAWWTEEEIDYAINDAGLSVLIADAERVLRSHGPASQANVPIIGVRLDEIAPTAPNVTHWKDALVYGVPMPAVDIEPTDDATILYTSGTTGFPKGAVSTNFAVVQAVMGFASNSAVTAARRDPSAKPDDGVSYPPCFILIVPLFHVTGCIPVMLSCFTWHFKLVMMYRWEPERALQLIERHRVTSFVGVPTQSWDMLECPNFSKYDTSSLASIGGGGAPAPPKLVARVEGSFTRGRPQLGYGMTETNAYGTGNYGDDYISHPTSTGRTPSVLMEFAIRDENGQDVPRGVRGEIWMKGATLIRGYWNKPDATAETIVNGWLNSGDIGRIDDEGFLYIEDRAKDMVLRAGENVYCAEVEAAIYDIPAVHEAAVFGVPHERLGEEVAVVVMLRAGATLSEDELRNSVAQRLASFKVPTRVAFTTEPLPRNPAGKFLKRELRQRYFV